MKFPYKLSKERLSLLSKEDKEIYEYEHSLLAQMLREGAKKAEALQLELNESLLNNTEELSESIEELSDKEKEELYSIFDDMLFEEIDSIMGKELKESYGNENYELVKEDIFDFTNEALQNDNNYKELNEAEGHGPDWWIPNIGWLGTFTAGALTGLLGLIAWLLMKGRDRLAAAKLKRYMNRLVELTDLGVYKKRPWYSFLIPNRDTRINTGEYSRGCFRTILETEERNMACLYTATAHALGFYNPNTTNFNDISADGLPQEGSGLDMFKNRILDNIKFNESTNT